MESKFVSPKSQKEFEELLENKTLKGAMSVHHALLARRASMVRSINEEIKFYEAAIKQLSGEAVDWEANA